MASIFRRRKGEIYLLLLIVAAALLAANLYKYGSIAWLAKNKDAIGSLSSIIGCILLLLAGIASYYRFFKGRMFSCRAEIDLSVSIHETPNAYLLHAIHVKLRNVGSVPLWKPRVLLEVHGHGTPDYRVSRSIESICVGLEQGINVIDSGESTSFFTHEQIPRNIWVVIYLVTVRVKSGEIWQETMTVSNKEIHKNQAANPSAAAPDADRALRNRRR